MLHQEAQPGLIELFDYLERERPQELRLGICTRNFDRPVEHLMDKFLPGRKIAPVVTRDFRPPKPDPAGILHIAKSWGLENGGENLIMVRVFLRFFLSFVLVTSASFLYFPKRLCSGRRDLISVEGFLIY